MASIQRRQAAPNPARQQTGHAIDGFTQPNVIPAETRLPCWLRGRMSKLHLSLLMLYLMAAAGYGGWRGPDLWSGWGVWCLLLPPLAWAGLKAVGEWRRNPYWGTVQIGLVMTVVAVVAIGGQALLLAWAGA